MDAPRLLRPVKTQGLYGNWTQYAPDDETTKTAMLAGRGEGRISRRRKRQQTLKDKEIAKRALKVERRRYAKEAMASVVAENGEGETTRGQENSGAAAPLDDKMARLRELRQRMMASTERS